MPKQSTTRYAVLGILSRGGASGYDIRKQIHNGIGYFWSESYGQIYPILKALHEEGCATKLTESQSGKPDRIVYSLTAKGRQELDAWLGEPLTYMHVERNELLLKLFFSSYGDVAQNLENIANYRARLVEVLKELDAVELRISSGNLDDEYRTYTLVSAKYGQMAYKAFIEWCDYATARLKDLAEKKTVTVLERRE